MAGAGKSRERPWEALLLAGVFLLAFCRLEDTDAFTHLASGREIVARGRIPDVEPFNFGREGESFGGSYRSWLFAVALHGAERAGGVPGIVLFKAATVVLGIWLLFRDALRGARPEVAAVALAAAALLSRFRFVERPDLWMLLFWAGEVLALRLFVVEERRWPLAAVPLAVLAWANSHASVVLWVVPVGAFAAVEGIAALRGPGGEERRRRLRRLGALALLAAACAAASLVSPYGASQATVAASVVKVPEFRFMISELAAPAWPRDAAAFVLPAVVLASFVAARRRAVPVDALLVLAPLALSLLYRRFLFLAAVAAAPVVARNVSALLSALEGRLPRTARRTASFLAAGWLLAAPPLAAFGVLGPDLPEKVPGAGLNEVVLPEKALAYLDRAGVTGRVLNTYHWGGFLEWRDFPRRAPFTDGRFALEPRLLQAGLDARRRPAALDALRERFGFETLLLDYPAALPGAGLRVDVGLPHPGWVLVYFDDLALVYLRRDGPFASVALRDGYFAVRPANPDPLTPAEAAAWVPELERAVRETGSARARLRLAEADRLLGRPREALALLGGIDRVPGFDLFRAAAAERARSLRALGDRPGAETELRRALARKETPALRRELGGLLEEAGDTGGAAREYARAAASDPSDAASLERLVALRTAAGDAAGARDAGDALERARRRLRAAELFREGIGLSVAGRPAEARERFRASLSLEPGSAAALANLGFAAFDLGDLAEARGAHERAVAIDPKLASARWGLAQVADRSGDRAAAARHLRAYLEIEPAGPWAAKARDALARLEAPGGAGR